MSIQDDIFDINDHLEGGNLEDAFLRILDAYTKEENERVRLTQLVIDLTTTVETLRRIDSKGNGDGEIYMGS